MEPKEREWERVDWIDLARDRDRWLAAVKTVMSPRIVLNSGKFLTSWETGSLTNDYLSDPNPIRCIDVCLDSPVICSSEISTIFLNWARKEFRISVTESSKIWLRSSVMWSCGIEWVAAPDSYEVPSVREKLHTERHSVASSEHYCCENLKSRVLKSVRYEILIAVNTKDAVEMWRRVDWCKFPVETQWVKPLSRLWRGHGKEFHRLTASIKLSFFDLIYPFSEICFYYYDYY